MGSPISHGCPRLPRAPPRRRAPGCRLAPRLPKVLFRFPPPPRFAGGAPYTLKDGGALPGFSRGRGRCPCRLCRAGPAERQGKFSSLWCQKRQAPICKARRPYQEPS
ncbi:hypothetical protein LUU34_00017200 [Aix galericulata]|nr:hypothetical protein LUU34_00017200 [Aix galericulata]